MTIAAPATTFEPPYLPRPDSYKQTHPGLFKIDFASGDFASCLRTEREFKAGEVLCKIEGTAPGHKQYSSVQVQPDPPLPGTSDGGRPRHIELCSDLLYVNHSCDPNVAFEVPSDTSRWCVRAIKDLKKGEIMTFAYFSTEWDMQQPFTCLCETSQCLGEIRGAKYISPEVLSKHFVNEHIRALKEHQLRADPKAAKNWSSGNGAHEAAALQS